MRFSSFELDLRSGELRKHGIRIKLQDQPFQILALLVEKPGEVVTREELRERLWPADTFVDFDHSLNSAVKKLRQALNDDPDTPRFIETLPRRGYRFIAAVANGAYAMASAPAGEFPGQPGFSSPTPSGTVPAAAQHHWKLWAAGAFGFVLALGLVAWFGFLPAPVKSPNLAPIRLVPLTTSSNGLSKPSFSPDGNQIAYSWSGENQKDGVDIYVKQIGTEKPLQVTHDFGYNVFPAWSPDGRYIAFLHGSRTEIPGIYLAPALGGPPRKLRDFPNLSQSCKPVLSWSPDGRLLAYSDRPSASSSCSVYQLSLEDLKTRQLTSPPSPSTGDGSPQYSPDGKTIAFIRNTKDVEDIYLMPAAGGEPHRLTFDNRLMPGLAWMPDSREIIFSSNRGGASWGLWRISAGGGTPERVPVGSDRAYGPALSMKGHRLAYCTGIWNEDIWRIALGPNHRAGKPEKFIFSELVEEGPQYSPDGKRIAFQSTRSGNFEIWRADADGTNLVQLTSMGGPLTGTPRWSPDGRWIAFDTRPEAHPNIHIVSSDGGPVRRFVNETSDDGVASWSHDGKWIYFASNRNGGWQVWKRTADGSGVPIQITRNGGFAPLESSDGKFLYYTKFDAPGAFRVSVAGGEEAKVMDEPPQGLWGYLAVGTDGLYFVGDNGNHKLALKFYDFATKKTAALMAMEKDPYFGAPGLSVSPDSRFVIYVQLDEARDNLMLAENFR